MSQSGYVYFASNPSMPGLLKIGMTNVSPAERLPELQSTGVPTPFILEACIRVIEPRKVEQRIHSLLSKWRAATDREFFQVSLSQAFSLCLPGIEEYLSAGNSKPDTAKARTLIEEEEKLLLYVARQTKEGERPTKREVQSHMKLSDIKTDYLFGSLLKRRFVREVSAEREDRNYPNGYYRIKALRLEPAGIQYLLDHQLLRQQDL